MPAVIVTGGSKYSRKESQEEANPISTDVAALEGATRYANQQGVPLEDCYEAWIPEPDLDTREDIQVVRMSEEDGITVRVMPGRTPLGRRLAMVAGVDMVVTISGKKHTEVVVEQALELGLPVLPIPNARGESETLLKKHRKRIATAFDPKALDKCLNWVSKSIDGNPDAAAKAVIELLDTAKVGKCLVLLPYDDVHKQLYTSLIKPAVAKHMIPVRLDHLPRSGAIYSSFADAVQTSLAVIADITELNHNVMYEIGFAHGRGVEPLLYTRETNRLEHLPVYFKTLNVRLESKETPLVFSSMNTCTPSGTRAARKGSTLVRKNRA
jgi:hypothetical protein